MGPGEWVVNLGNFFKYMQRRASGGGEKLNEPGDHLVSSRQKGRERESGELAAAETQDNGRRVHEKQSDRRPILSRFLLSAFGRPFF